MKKNLLIAAIAITALASCSSNDFVGDESPQTSSGNVGAISFNLNTAAVTRATTGAGAANALDNQFIVWGEKNESGGAAVAVPSANSVFPNYQVNWVNKAHSTTSNSSGWEYVGYTHSNTASTDDYQTNITPHLGVAQEIKYWDNSATNYVFTAVSALKDDIKTGKIQISKTLSGTDEFAKGYTITAAAGADFSHLYFADRYKITENYGTTPVTMNFRSLLSQIRVGIYETIPGYNVTAIKFYNTTNFEDANEFKTTGDNPTSIFGATVDNLKPGANTLTVTYNSTTNQPIVSTSGNPETTITLGQNFNTLTSDAQNPVYMATSSAQPTWETAEGAYTPVFPREGVTTDMTLKVKYTLYNAHSGETIDITGDATVPGKYLQWKPNYKYSYLFKLTDNALTPITFDAVVVADEAGNQETITTVDDPSITTYAKASAVTTNDEYVTNNDIYVAVQYGGANPSNPALTVSNEGNAKLYYVTYQKNSEDLQVTEAAVANAIAHGTYVALDKTWTITEASGSKMVVTDTEENLLTASTTIPAEASPTGAALTINVAKFKPQAKYVQVTPSDAVLTNGVAYYSQSNGGGEGFVGNGSRTAGDSTYRRVSDWTGYYVFEYKDGSGNKHYKVIKVVNDPNQS